MKYCPHCGTKLEEGAVVCPSCGGSLAQPESVVYVDAHDHSAEFSVQDVSDNKVLAMLPYLMGIMGLVIAMLARTESPYIRFHTRQYLKICVCETLVALISGVLCWTFIVPFVGIIAALVLLVVRFICFFQICGGKAKEPAIVRNLGFLK